MGNVRCEDFNRERIDEVEEGGYGNYTFPVSEDGVKSFLASPYVEGIGLAFAKKMVNHFGLQAVRMIKNSPLEVAELIPGLGVGRAEKASESLRSIPHDINLLLFLFSCGIADTYVERILSKYKKRAVEVVFSDPYSMVEDVWKLSFFVADRIGEKLGIAKDDPFRLQAALVTAVRFAAEAGHLFATEGDAVASASRIAGIDPESIAHQIDNAVASGRIVRSRGVLYLPVFYNAEKDGAEKLSRLASAGVSEIQEVELPERSLHGHTYSPMQKEAIRNALEYPVTVITGGPGSGKTTVVKGIIDILVRKGKKVVLCAPTGRAAKRLSDLTGLHATTIHHLLGYRREEGYHTKKIDADVLIIDESSMMEQVLFNHLLQATGSSVKIIMIGDTAQFPAIGAGDVLSDLIVSGLVPVVHLNENFRQAGGSLIASGARAISNGEYPQSDSDRDFLIIPEHDVARIHERILSLAVDELPELRSISPMDILVVTPQQIGRLGARQLNMDLQQKVNPEGPALKRGESIMRLGDPVMQTANSRDRGVYNGEVGRISAVDIVTQRLEVTFPDGRKSYYSRSDLSELTLAYATTVHKLQGSEAKNIIIPVTMAHKPMLYRNLLYTAVSRASNLCVLVGDEEALRYAIGNTPAESRNSNFKYRLKKGCCKKEAYSPSQSSSNQSADHDVY